MWYVDSGEEEKDIDVIFLGIKAPSPSEVGGGGNPDGGSFKLTWMFKPEKKMW